MGIWAFKGKKKGPELLFVEYLCGKDFAYKESRVSGLGDAHRPEFKF